MISRTPSYKNLLDHDTLTAKEQQQYWPRHDKHHKSRSHLINHLAFELCTADKKPLVHFINTPTTQRQKKRTQKSLHHQLHCFIQ
jgi:hypothetical protein